MGTADRQDLVPGDRAHPQTTRAPRSGAQLHQVDGRTTPAVRGPVPVRVVTTRAGTGAAGPVRVPGRGVTTRAGTGAAGPVRVPGRGADPRQNGRQPDGARTEQRPDLPAMRQTVVGLPRPAGRPARPAAAGRASIRPVRGRQASTGPESPCRRYLTASRPISWTPTPARSSGRFRPTWPTRWRASWSRPLSTRIQNVPIRTRWRPAASLPESVWSGKRAGSRHTGRADGQKRWPSCGPRGA